MHGFIISKFDLDAGRPLGFEQITAKLVQVVSLYGEFAKFCRMGQDNGEDL